MEWTHDGYTISDDAERLDVEAIHAFLADAYWSRGIPRDLVARSIAASLNLGLFAPGGAQVGFARVVTDRATFAWLGDVYVLGPHRGRGLATRLVELAVGHPELAGIRRWMLATHDAHSVYAKVGFAVLAHPERHMERLLADPYGRPGDT